VNWSALSAISFWLNLSHIARRQLVSFHSWFRLASAFVISKKIRFEDSVLSLPLCEESINKMLFGQVYVHGSFCLDFMGFFLWRWWVSFKWTIGRSTLFWTFNKVLKTQIFWKMLLISKLKTPLEKPLKNLIFQCSEIQ
jgi:hypothetical protein